MMIKDYMLSENTLLEDFFITKRSDGRFFTRVKISYDNKIKRYFYKNIYGRDKFEVKYKRSEFIKQKIEEQKLKSITAGSLVSDLENWLYNNKYGSVKNTYFDRLEEVYNHQIKPAINALPDEQIKTINVASEQCHYILEYNLKKDYSYSTLLKIYRLLNEFFDYLHQNGKIKVNPIYTIKMYSKSFVISNQQLLREQRSVIEQKIKQNKEITDDEFNIISSELIINDKTEMRILSEEDKEKIKEVIYNGYYLKYTAKNGKVITTGPFYLR